MVSLLCSPSAAMPSASSPSRLRTSTKQRQPWIISLPGDRALQPVSVRCHGHAGQPASNVSPSSRHRGLPSIQVTARLNSSAHYSLALGVLARNTLTSSIQRKMNATKPRRRLTVGCEYGNGSKGGNGGDFFAGFLLGGAICGTLAYVFAPQIRSLLNEDEHGFWRGNKPYYYDEGHEKTRQMLNEKISQLNSAIDNVSSRLRGKGNDVSAEESSIEVDSEVEELEASV